jgi:nicotinate-nucleotide adenylyltransferase
MTRRPRVGVLGGTFDPVHEGHLAVARAAIRALNLERLAFVPAGDPLHRPDRPRASGYHRMEMLRRAADDALGGEPCRVEVSDLEVFRDGPSFTYDTLLAFQAQGLTPVQMIFITGADAFAEIETWHRYPEVLNAAHFAVVPRPGSTLASLRQKLPGLASRMIEPKQLDDADAPRIILVAAETPAIAATDIRARAGRGESLEGLVPASVAAYIEQHALYGDEPDAPDATDAPGSPPHGQVPRH